MIQDVTLNKLILLNADKFNKVLETKIIDAQSLFSENKKIYSFLESFNKDYFLLSPNSYKRIDDVKNHKINNMFIEFDFINDFDDFYTIAARGTQFLDTYLEFLGKETYTNYHRRLFQQSLDMSNHIK